MSRENIIFFGSGDYVIPIIEKLIPHNLDLVVTTEKNPKSELLKFCKEKNIEVLIASTKSDLINHKSLFINHSVAILASYGAFIPKEVISFFPEGIINIHPSLLPKWKGPSPVQYSLLNGDTQTGVSLIKLDNEIDHGPILSQRVFKLKGNETSKDLLQTLFGIGAEMTEELIIKLEKGEKLTETPQNHKDETWSYKIEKKDGKIDLNSSNIQDQKSKIQTKIRAFYPWPGVWFTAKLKGQTKIVKLLPNEKIQVEGKNPMSYKDFINGYENEGKNLLEKLGLS
jgi:methionyl-tRNA formyltransferase